MKHMYNAKTIGARIKQCRIAAGMSQPALAARLGLAKNSRPSISKWEHGASLPSTNQLFAMCEIFNCDIGYLVGDYEREYLTAEILARGFGIEQETLEGLWIGGLNNRDDLTIRRLALNRLLQTDDFLLALESVDLCIAHGERLVKETYGVESQYTSDDDPIVLAQQLIHPAGIAEASVIGTVYQAAEILVQSLKSWALESMKGGAG